MKDDDQASWDYKPSGGVAVADKTESKAANAGEASGSNSSMTWTASEYIEHQRGLGWYLVLAVGAAVLAAIFYFLFHDIIGVAVIILLGVVVASYVGRKPRELQYELNSKGIHVGEKFYAYSTFRSFSIIREGGISNLELMPLKKLALPVEAYFGPGDEERIMDIIGQHLPYEERQMAAVDKVSRKLRF